MKKVGWRNVNDNTNFTVEAKNISAKSAVGELKQNFRKDFVNKCSNNYILKSLKDFIQGSVEMIDYTSLHMSNIGTFPIGGDIKDAYIALSTYTLVPPPGFVILFSTCIENEIYRGRLICSPSVMDRYDALKFASAIKHCMTSVPDGMKVQNVVQNLILKYHF